MVKGVLSSVTFAMCILAGCGGGNATGEGQADGDSSSLGNSEPQTALSEASGPAFDCSEADGTIEEMVCSDSELALLDRKLDQVYQTAVKSPKGKSDKLLKASQIGWIKGRNECWKATDKRQCILNNYQRRIAELQALYSLVPGKGPIVYRCSGGDVIATYYQTDPPSAVAEFNGEQSLMFQQPSGSGARYQGRNESLWEHQGEATVIWGAGAAEMRCKID